MINETRKIVDTSHKNFMQGSSWFLKNPIHTLQMAAASSFFGEPQYYIDGEKDAKKVATIARPYGYGSTHSKYLNDTLTSLTPVEWKGLNASQLMESAIDKALDYDPEATLKLAGQLRNEWNIRTTPQVILVRAAHHLKVKGTSLIREYAPSIIKRADEPAVGLAYQISRFGRKSIPNSLKRAWKAFLENTNDYNLAKYTMKNRTIKTVDVVNLVHPKSESVSRLVKGELSQTGETWEAIISAKGSNKESWTEALNVMGHMALLRNLRNLLENKVDPKLFMGQLIAGVATGKQLPFRYFSAAKAIPAGSPGFVLDGLEKCLLQAIDNLPKFKGKTMSLCDNSGSAWGATTSSMGSMEVAQIANLTAWLTALSSEEGHIGRFGDTLLTEVVRKRQSIFDKLNDFANERNKVGQSTENGIWLFWDKAIKEKQHWDTVFIYSDMQAGHGGLYGTNPSSYKEFQWNGSGAHIDVPKLIQEYRRKVNPNVNVFLVQVAGYQDTIIPEYFNRTYILGGWSDQILQFASQILEKSDNKQ